MHRRTLVIFIVVVLLGGTGYYWFKSQEPDLSRYDSLVTPHIIKMDSMKVLQVKAVGDPNAVGGQAFKLLFKTYFKLSGVPKNMHPPAPRARWPVSLDQPKTAWTGYYALPVPAVVNQLPQVETTPGLSIELIEWPYGDVAEILHKGPYSQETPAIEKLKKFIVDSGCRIIGDHEEEYLKGPTMWGKGDPEKYYTIIRYQVAKMDKK